MRTAGISVANQIEVDSNSTMLSLIAQGAGWTISRASTILQNKGLMNEILYLPMPEPLLVRKVYVLTRQNEPSALMQEFTQLACSILKESVAPELIKIAPWLKQDIFVLDPTSGVMVDMTGKRADERRILSLAHDYHELKCILFDRLAFPVTMLSVRNYFDCYDQQRPALNSSRFGLF